MKRLKPTAAAVAARRSPPASFKGLPPSTIPNNVFVQIPDVVRLDDLILAERTRTAIDDLLIEHKHAEALRARGIEPALRVLLIGPPGTGKTSVAAAIAEELGRWFFVSNMREVVASWMGETTRRIGDAFEYARVQPGVFLFDEIDGLAPQRGATLDSSADKEWNLSLTALLTAFDQHRAPSIILAATNRADILDRALLRRFDLVIDFEMPTNAQRVALAQRVFGNDDGAWVRCPKPPDAFYETWSHAEVVTWARAQRRRQIVAEITGTAVPPISTSTTKMDDATS
jgi:SpoVK/Ycf46/Vps4 family AAA+-type ATPase